MSGSVPPKPPQGPVPPLPPDFKLQQPVPPAGGRAAAGGLADFLVRRLEALEKDLALERERARGAQEMLQRQEALKGEVEAQLRALSEQLRREKTERDGEERRAQAQGRIEALEKRLDEIHDTWAALLKETMAQRSAPAAPAREPAQPAAPPAWLEEVRRWSEGVHAGQGRLEGDWLARSAQWEASLGALAAVPAEVRRLAEAVAAAQARGDETLARRLESWSRAVESRLGEIDRRLAADSIRRDGQQRAAENERAALSRAVAEENQRLLESLAREKVARETEDARASEAATQRMTALAEAQGAVARSIERIEKSMEGVWDRLNADPPARDEALRHLQAEKDQLLKALEERGQLLERLGSDRVRLQEALEKRIRDSEEEAALQREGAGEERRRLLEAQGGLRAAQDELEAARRGREADERLRQALAAERDAAAKSLLELAARVRATDDERRQAEEEGARREAGLRSEAAKAAEELSRLQAALAELKSQVSTLASELTRALRERDALQSESEPWRRERQSLLDALRKKDEMIALLSQTFQGIIKKQ